MRVALENKVYIVGGGYEYIRLMYELGFSGATNVEEADYILFTGGEDVNPALYGERALQVTRFNTNRDEYEKRIFETAKELGKPMIGICRGGQFLNVMNDGKLWQHVNNHGNPQGHFMWAIDNEGGSTRKLKVTSTHHQMMIPGKDAIVLAVAQEATDFMSFPRSISKPQAEMSDVEVVWYPDTGCLCFQPHPEFRHAPKECRDYFNECLDNFVMPFAIK